VVKSLAEYADADSQRSVQRLVDAAVQQDAFLKALAGGIVKNEKAKLKPHVGAAAKCCCRCPSSNQPVHCRQRLPGVAHTLRSALASAAAAAAPAAALTAACGA
jgi:hypothetical protein